MPGSITFGGAESGAADALGTRGRLLAACVLLISASVLIFGWGLNQPHFTSFGSQFSAMVPSTAFLLFIGASAVLLDHRKISDGKGRSLSTATAVIMVAIPVAQVGLAATGVANGLDQFIWPENSAFITERMSEATALSFLLLGLCIWQFGVEDRSRRLLVVCATFGALLSLLALIVFAFDARSLSSVALFSTMSLPTAVAFLMLFGAIIVRYRKDGWVSVFSGDALGSVSLRRTVPWAVGLPLLLAFGTSFAMRRELFDENFQLSLLALGTTLVIGTILVKEAFKANRLEAKAKTARLLIAEAEEREASLERKRASAELAVEAKTKFLANMSHEIRTPMNGILGFAELVLQDNLTPDQRSKIELIHESGKTMLKLIDDILDLAKIDTGHMSVSAEVVDLRHIANSCVKMFQVAAAKKGLALELHAASDIGFEALGDPLRMRQVLTNIIGNAIKFTEKGRIDVEVTKTTDYVVVVISDTGIGIARHMQASVLGEFVQADESTQRQYGGSGLGLHISKKLVELMQGDLTLSSELGSGTRVRIALPAAMVAHSGTAISVEPVDALTESNRRWRGKRIGVAEDHDINQMMIADMILYLGAEPFIFPNGAAAVSAIETAQKQGHQFDLLLMDIQMPELDGISATKEIRKRGYQPNALPIIAMTANAFDTDIRASLDAGMQAHLAKPVSLEKLDQAFSEWIEA